MHRRLLPVACLRNDRGRCSKPPASVYWPICERNAGGDNVRSRGYFAQSGDDGIQSTNFPLDLGRRMAISVGNVPLFEVIQKITLERTRNIPRGASCVLPSPFTIICFETKSKNPIFAPIKAIPFSRFVHLYPLPFTRTSRETFSNWRFSSACYLHDSTNPTSTFSEKASGSPDNSISVWHVLL